MQNESITQIDYRHPLQVIEPGTMATYRQTNRRGYGWRPMACLIVAQSPNSPWMAKIRIAGWQAMKRCYKEVWVHRSKLYPAVETVLALHEEYIKAQIMERVTKRMLAEVKAVLQPDSQEEFDAGYEAMQEGAPYNSAQTSGWKNGWVQASKRYGGVTR